MTSRSDSEPKSTPLLTAHQRAGARIVDFAGFRMPLQYSGIVDEHRTVRQAVGLFDVSHMGEVDFTGPRAVEAVHRLVTNDVTALTDSTALYTPICQHDGGIVDDCIVYRFGPEHLRIVVNASNIASDHQWFVEQTGDRCTIENRSDDFALIAVQGPRAVELWQRLAGEPVAAIDSFAFAEVEAAGIRCVSARTGYTGEDGFEVFCPAERALELWSALSEAGADLGVKPCGLGARDTLRLEAKLMLYGNDIDRTTTPLEAGLGWTVKLDAGEFVGREALLEQKSQKVSRKLVGMVMRSRGIARQGHAIVDDEGNTVGRVTSGTRGPWVKEAIALGYVPRRMARRGTQLHIDVRGKRVEAEVVKGPFYKRST